MKAALLRLDAQQPPVLMVAFNPYAGLQLVGHLQEKATMYYCYDEISHAAWISKHGGRLEKQLMQKADAVLVSSAQLMEDKRPYCHRIFLMKNGVNTSIFGQAFQPNPVIGRRQIGFIGSLDNRVDYELLLAVVKALPDWQFSFTGRLIDQDSFRPIQALPNVSWTPSVPPESLPQILASFDVGIIPFAKTGFTKAIYPLKINEYLMAGLPVVTTRFTHLDDFEPFCHVADDAQ
ncbi:MAG: glycosyltransferase, partial [Chitinophagaceae bacterium]|nr:glycosyltransferase [Chitinophagaceae bacterium]